MNFYDETFVPLHLLFNLIDELNEMKNVAFPRC